LAPAPFLGVGQRSSKENCFAFHRVVNLFFRAIIILDDGRNRSDQGDQISANFRQLGDRLAWGCIFSIFEEHQNLVLLSYEVRKMYQL
jgi:hypothetical protein